ncbi:Helix-turn-helix domain of resolvase [Pseudobutyrivibrio sp. C4]|uniref:helix-turn-helix domain-containing protein n=1 Tax=Pseudobutyrivibrio sp. C4 TaxID=1520803 RepID=UPI0008BB01A0|nr:helix-turn-helix domain-containing protein [Pseudobutyrivibrio sp. C4]SET33789.1 Helix-turn-helix domain of resolvase [Pseudobutyrivibrio sp. C4]
MGKYTLEQALERIDELEKENFLLKQELANLKERKPVGRKVHDEKWMKGYKEFVAAYESGKTIVEIENICKISKRTVYRYKSYYDKLKDFQTEQ